MYDVDEAPLEAMNRLPHLRFLYEGNCEDSLIPRIVYEPENEATVRRVLNEAFPQLNTAAANLFIIYRRKQSWG